MVNGYYNGIAGLRVAALAQETVASNLANAETVGFKAARPFVAVLAQALGSSPGAAPQIGGPGIDLTQGALRPTGAPLDFALEGSTLLAIETPAGERYTRDGRLAIDPRTGRLVTLAGHPVLGASGPITVAGGEATIGDDGSVLIAGEEAGRLKLVTAPPPGDLRPEGGGLYAATGPLAAAVDPRVRPGFVEASNVDPVRGAVSLIEALRSFEAIERANQLLLGDVAKALFEESGRTLPR